MPFDGETAKRVSTTENTKKMDFSEPALSAVEGTYERRDTKDDV